MAGWIKIKNLYINIDLLKSIVVYRMKREDGTERTKLMIYTETHHFPIACKEGVTAEQMDRIIQEALIKLSRGDRNVIDLSDYVE